jgi:hypothetical protein
MSDTIKNKVHLCLFALRNIKPGEEIRYDYGPDNGDMPWRKKQLTEPFVKIEDTKRMYKPQLATGKTQQHINFDGDISRGVFSSQEIVIESVPASKRKAGVNKQPRTRYCECCDVTFSNLPEHLHSPQHLAFAQSEQRYAKLDASMAGLQLSNLIITANGAAGVTEGVGHSNYVSFQFT